MKISTREKEWCETFKKRRKNSKWKMMWMAWQNDGKNAKKWHDNFLEKNVKLVKKIVGMKMTKKIPYIFFYIKKTETFCKLLRFFFCEIRNMSAKKQLKCFKKLAYNLKNGFPVDLFVLINGTLIAVKRKL